MRHRGRVQTGGDEAGEVRHVGPQIRADLVGDGAERLEVEGARVGGPAGDEHLRALGQGLLTDAVHVDAVGLRVDLVGDDVVELAGEVELHAVGEVTTVRQGQTHDLVAGIGQGVEDGGVGLRAGVRLDVGELGAEQGLRTVAGEILDDVGVLAASVVATARVALRVLVGEDRTLRLQHGAGDEVLGGDHLEEVALTGDLATDGGVDLRVENGQFLVAKVRRLSGHGRLSQPF